MHFVILFSVCILFGGASGCDMCKIDFGNFATCTGEVCPFYASYVEVECFIRNITTLVPIVQLRIRGKLRIYCTVCTFMQRDPDQRHSHAGLDREKPQVQR